MKTTLIALCLLVPVWAFSQEYSSALTAARMDLDSAWQRTTRPVADMICLPAASNLLRKDKNMSDHDLLEKTINTAKVEGAETAMPWLLAAFCYDPPAQDRVAKAGKEAIRYIMNKWGGGEQTIAGYPAAPVQQPVELKMNFTNKTGDWLYFFSLITDEAEGKRDCKDYVYMGQLAPNRSQLQVIGKGQYLWIRFADKKAKDGCTTFKKEFKVGPSVTQETSTSEEIIIR